MNPGGRGVVAPSDAAAERLLIVAVKLLGARDFVGSKKVANRALELDPLLDGADQVLAVADVLLAAQCRINNQVDWYAILQLDPASSGRDPSAVRRQYRRLALLLRPETPGSLPGSDRAYKIVSDAWSVLSDPSKKSLLDAELEIAAAHLPSGGPHKPPPPAAPAVEHAFWTACPSCCHMHLYERGYEDLCLRCPTCRRAFHAASLAAAPPIVPGTDSYYCSWGFFPLGFPGEVPASVGLEGGFKPFYPMSPWWGNQPSQPSEYRENSMNTPEPNEESPADSKKGNVVGHKTSATLRKVPPFTNRKAVAKKTVQNCFKKRVLESEDKVMAEAGRPEMVGPKAGEGTKARPLVIDINEEVVIDINEEVGCLESNGIVGEHAEMDCFDIEVDVSKLPFWEICQTPLS